MKGIIGSAGFALGGMATKAYRFASIIDNATVIARVPVLHPVVEAE